MFCYCFLSSNSYFSIESFVCFILDDSPIYVAFGYALEQQPKLILTEMDKLLKPNELEIIDTVCVKKSKIMSIVGVNQISEQCLLLDNGERMFTVR